MQGVGNTDGMYDKVVRKRKKRRATLLALYRQTSIGRAVGGGVRLGLPGP